jgi:alpha-1,2-mannosyltransferase
MTARAGQPVDRARAWWPALAAVAAVGIAVALAFLVRPHVEEGPWTTLDLQVFHVSGDAVWHGADPYRFLLPQADLSLVYPPFAGLLFAPLSLLTMEALRIVWFTGIFVALQGLVWLATGWVGMRRGWPRLLLCPAVAAAAVFFAPVYQELWSGQVNVFLALLVVADLCRRDGARGRGLLIGIAAGIKLTPGLFILYFLLTKRFREAWTALAGFAATVAIGFAVMPGPAWRYWTHYAWDADRIYPDPRIPFNQNLRGAFARLLDDPDVLVPWVLTAVVVLAAGLAVAVGLDRRGLVREGAVLVGVVSLLVSPVSWVYHWVWLIPTVIVLAARAVQARSVVWGVAAAVAAVVPVLTTYPSLGEGGWQVAHGLWQSIWVESLVLVGLVLLVAGALALRPARVAAPTSTPAR